MDAESPKKRVPLYYYPALCLLSIVVRLLYLTLRVRVSEKSNGNMRREGASVLIFWHNKISLAPYIKRKFRKRFPIFGLVSQSKDGEILECFFRFFGIDSERGSSSKGGAKAVVSLIRKLKQGKDVCVTPDGPRGPVHEMKPGVMAICKKSTAKILFIRWNMRSAWVLNSWDKFQIPKPFSVVELEADEIENYVALEDMAKHRNMSVESLSASMLGN